MNLPCNTFFRLELNWNVLVKWSMICGNKSGEHDF